MGLLAAAVFATPCAAQSGYRTPPDAITKILDSPAAPAVSLSSDRKWLLITTADIPETTIAELAGPTLFLAGRRFRTLPRHRIDVEGIRTASLKPVDGGAEIAIPVPNGARLASLQWNRDVKRLAYFIIARAAQGVGEVAFLERRDAGSQACNGPRQRVGKQEHQDGAREECDEPHTEE
jgi:hypothetical protein